VWGVSRSSTGPRAPLPIPEILESDENGLAHLKFQTGNMPFLEGFSTHTLGINGPYLAPTIKATRGQKITFRVENGLEEPVTLHWHGLEIPGHVDGGPHQIIEPGGIWTPTLHIDQPAATCWYHPHFYPSTADLVVKGLAGLFVIEDDEIGKLSLPSDWGIDDIPLVIQDRRFTPDGEIDYELLDIVNVATGYAGDKVLVNGALYPEVKPPAGWVRFRMLNGSNARSYNIAMSDERPFYVIGSDGGLLSEPVKVTSIPLRAAERYEVLVSTHDRKPFEVVTTPVQQMGMTTPPFDKIVPLLTVTPSAQEATGKMPDQLANLPSADPTLATVTRRLVLAMDDRLDGQAMALMMERKMSQPMADANGQSGNDAMPLSQDEAMKAPKLGPLLTREELKTINSINGRSFDMQHIEFEAIQGRLEHWIISQGTDRMVHPVHLHGCQFRILSLDGEPPPAYAQGWKDVVTVSGGRTSEILVQFNHKADANSPFMAHCHILEHEDTGMMTQFIVS